MVNTFHRNDYQYNEDEISLAIYSDVYDQMFKCGKFEMHGGDAIDFGGLVIPCREVIAVSLLEYDELDSNSGNTMLIPCAIQNQEVDFLLTNRNNSVDIKNLDKWAQEINFINANSFIRPVKSFASSITGENIQSSADLLTGEERDSLFQFKFRGMMTEVPKIQLDSRFNQMNLTCGASLLRFTD